MFLPYSYAGDAIHCELDGESVDQDVANQYCWIHGTSHIEQSMKDLMDQWFDDNDGVEDPSPICNANKVSIFPNSMEK